MSNLTPNIMLSACAMCNRRKVQKNDRAKVGDYIYSVAGMDQICGQVTAIANGMCLILTHGGEHKIAHLDDIEKASDNNKPTINKSIARTIHRDENEIINEVWDYVSRGNE